jgi:hypothetical protein
MDPREELAALRRLSELEAKAGVKPATRDEEMSFGDKVLAVGKSKLRDAGNLVAGGIRGAGSIGSTILAPVDIAKDALDGKGLSLESNRKRRADMDHALKDLGANPDSFLYQVGKLATEVAGTAGAGPSLGVGGKALGLGQPIVNALSSGGFRASANPGAVNMLTRIVGGAAAGGASAGLVDPAQAGTGAVVGGVLPPAVAASGWAGNLISENMRSVANRLMQSAIKPTIKQLQTGDAAIATQTLLDRGISPNAAGVNKLRDLIGGLDDEITNAISGSKATVQKAHVLNPLVETYEQFGRQVSPSADLRAIRGVADDFMSHPAYAGDSLPVQAAQELKKGTYKALSKKYGQMGGAEVEAQKALARGLKDEIATAVPEIAGLNAQQAKLITTLKVAERRALMELNKNPGGLSLLANNPTQWAIFMADKSALFKSMAARMVNATSNVRVPIGSVIEKNPLLSSSVARTAVLANEGSP